MARRDEIEVVKVEVVEEGVVGSRVERESERGGGEDTHTVPAEGRAEDEREQRTENREEWVLWRELARIVESREKRGWWW